MRRLISAGRAGASQNQSSTGSSRTDGGGQAKFKISVRYEGCTAELIANEYASGSLKGAAYPVTHQVAGMALCTRRFAVLVGWGA